MGGGGGEEYKSESVVVNVKAKSLRTFVGNHPEMKAIRFSMLPYDRQDRMTNVPLYVCLVAFS